jgi:actin-like ATPase involved in cell morphogenesis
MAWPWAPAGLSVDPGPDTTWSSGTKFITEPAAVAVDDTGAPRACGSRAVLVAARRGSGLHLARPFTSMTIDDPALTRAYLRWVIETAGGRRRRPTLMVVVPALSRPEITGMWRQLAESVGVRPLVVERPIAALAGLGIDAAEGTAHMVVDAERDATEVAVVADGSVVDVRQTSPLSIDVAATAAAIRSLVVTIDPDFELDIADQGIHLVGREVADARLAAELAARVGFPVNMAKDPGRVVIAGAQRTMETVRPYLAQVLSRRRVGVKGVRGGFAR